MNWTYDDFKEAFYQLTGIDLSLYKERQMKRRIESLMLRTSIKSYESFIAKLSKDKDELNDFIDYITINVSEFFRNPEQWKILDREIIPLLWGKFDQLKIWCTACSTGEEPYSLAMILSKHKDCQRYGCLYRRSSFFIFSHHVFTSLINLLNIL